MTVAAAIELYCREQEVRPQVAATRRARRGELALFLANLETGLPCQRLCSEHLAGFLVAMKHCAGTTLNERCRQVRCFLRWAGNRGEISPKLGADWKWPRARVQPWVPSQQQVLQLLDAPPHTTQGLRDRLVLELLYGTGVRRSESSALNLADYEETGGLWIRQGKGHQDRLQPVGEFLRSQIQHYLDEVRPKLRPSPEENALLLNRSGRRLQHPSVANLVKKYAKKLNLPLLSPHSLRRAFSVHMLQNGVNIAYLQQLLGHRRPETTVHYAQVSLEDLQQVYRRYHPRAVRQKKRNARPF